MAHDLCDDLELVTGGGDDYFFDDDDFGDGFPTTTGGGGASGLQVLRPSTLPPAPPCVISLAMAIKFANKIQQHGAQPSPCQ
jgi:hypothetical protein